MHGHLDSSDRQTKSTPTKVHSPAVEVVPLSVVAMMIMIKMLLMMMMMSLWHLEVIRVATRSKGMEATGGRVSID